MAFPTPVRRGIAVSSTSNATSWTPAWTLNTNTAISAGELVRWYVFISSDGNTDLSETGGNGWERAAQQVEATNNVTAALFFKDTNTAFAAGSCPAFVLGSSASEQFSAVIFAAKLGTAKAAAQLTPTTSQGSSTNSDPAAITNNSGASQDLEVVVFRAGDGATVVASAAPTNYANLQSRAGGGTQGAGSNTADRQVTVASAGTENPGTFTSASEQWACITVGLYEASSAVGATGVATETDTALPRASARPVERAEEADAALALTGDILYKQLDPLKKHTDVTLSNSDKTAATTGTGDWRGVLAVDARTDTRYFEVVKDSGNYSSVGVANASASLTFLANDTNAVIYSRDGGVYYNYGVLGGALTNLGAYTDGDVIGCVYDPSAGTVKFNKNGGAWSSAISVPGIGVTWYAAIDLIDGQATINLGDVAFAQAPPAGVLGYNVDTPAGGGALEGPVGLSTETDSALALGVARPVGVATETDSALTLSSKVSLVVGLAAETDGALALGAKISKAAGVSAETNTARALGVARPVGLSTSTNAALALGVARPAGLATETATALARSAIIRKQVGVANEADAALTLGAKLARAVGVSTEAETALPLSARISRLVGLAPEFDTALALAGRVSKQVGLASEADEALAPGGSLTVGRANETDTAFALAAVLFKQVGRADEVDSALARGTALSVGRADEVDLALALAAPAPPVVRKRFRAFITMGG